MNELNEYLKDPKFIKWLQEPDEQLEAYWENWKNKHPDKVNELQQARALFKAIQFNHYPVSEEAKLRDWEAIQKKLKNGAHNKKGVAMIYKIASAIVLLFASVVAVYFVVNTNEIEDAPKVTRVHKKAELGQKLTVQLPDGTTVKLNAGSEITYPSAFSDSIRNVELSGEGYFEVKNNPSYPFNVHSGNVIISVLGTSFNVNGYDENKVEVSLVEGKVEINAKAKEQFEKHQLSPGEKATWNKSGFEVGKFDLSKDIGWKDNILVFHGNNIDEIEKILERWYGVNINVHEQEKILKAFYGEFKNESLENVLMSLSHALKFDFQINNKSVNIKPDNEYE